MTIAELGSLGELIAAVATVATLLYLALQLRANAASIRGEARAGHRATLDAVHLALARDEALAEIFQKGLATYNDLSRTEHTRFIFLMGSYVSALDAAHEQYKAGILSFEHLDNIRNTTDFVFKAPGGKIWWATYGARFSESFREYVQEYIYGSAR